MPLSGLPSSSLALSNLKARYSQCVKLIKSFTRSCIANISELWLSQPKQTSALVRNLFSTGNNKAPVKEEIENVGGPDGEPDGASPYYLQVRTVKQNLARVGITSFTEKDVEYMLRATDAYGDPQETFEMLVILADSQEGIIREYNPNVKLLGAVNRKGVTCYLDALLFAMFARLGSFEAILYNSFDDEPRKRLAMLLRLWVNVLRSGRLINEDIVRPSLVKDSPSSYELISIPVADDASSERPRRVRVERSRFAEAAGSLGSIYVHHRKTRIAFADSKDGHISHRERRCC